MASLQLLDGAIVLSINGDNPFIAADATTKITGAWELVRIDRSPVTNIWEVGITFAQQSLPLNDSVTLKVQCVNKAKTDTNYVGNWLVQNSDDLQQHSLTRPQPSTAAIIDTDGPQELLNVMLDTLPLSNVAFPDRLTPPQNRPSFSSETAFSYSKMVSLGFCERTARLKDSARNGITRSNHWLHWIVLLGTKIRAGTLAQLVVESIIANNADPSVSSPFNPRHWTNDNNGHTFALDAFYDLTPTGVTNFSIVKAGSAIQITDFGG
ncbi:hypothetical protein D9758_016947 [Tetrapyrgos nigripes]|uniref:Uncharacterized protein n=1 Tax=Tetrapyrgos nigripes TaxID=182062 RepID=A0A8H5BZC9_9AGAR|nr:hypothetical protein D9758_016947 [Tetrapyrgos nigripes]